MSNIEDSILQNPVETQLESSHFNSATPDLATLAANKSFNSPNASNKLNTKALLSLVFSILGIIIPFLGFAAIPFGIYAKQEIIKGKTLNNILATIGIVLATVVTVLDVFYAYGKIWH